LNDLELAEHAGLPAEADAAEWLAVIAAAVAPLRQAFRDLAGGIGPLALAYCDTVDTLTLPPERDEIDWDWSPDAARWHPGIES
jgi:hypothetical protein